MDARAADAAGLYSLELTAPDGGGHPVTIPRACALRLLQGSARGGCAPPVRCADAHLELDPPTTTAPIGAAALSFGLTRSALRVQGRSATRVLADAAGRATWRSCSLRSPSWTPPIAPGADGVRTKHARPMRPAVLRPKGPTSKET